MLHRNKSSKVASDPGSGIDVQISRSSTPTTSGKNIIFNKENEVKNLRFKPGIAIQQSNFHDKVKLRLDRDPGSDDRVRGKMIFDQYYNNCKPYKTVDIANQQSNFHEKARLRLDRDPGSDDRARGKMIFEYFEYYKPYKPCKLYNKADRNRGIDSGGGVRVLRERSGTSYLGLKYSKCNNTTPKCTNNSSNLTLKAEIQSIEILKKIANKSPKKMSMLPRRKPRQHWWLGLTIKEGYYINKLRVTNDYHVTSYLTIKKYKNLPVTMWKKKFITRTHTYFEETSSIYIDNEIGVISLATARLSRRSLFVFDNG